MGTRPGWQPDVKWIISLLAIGVAASSLILATLAQLTERQPVVNGIAYTYAIMTSGEKGLDDPSDVKAISEQATQSSDGRLQPIPGISITINAGELEGLSPREARLAFMRKIAEPIYDGGAEGFAALATDPELKSKILSSRATLDLLSHKTRDRIVYWLKIDLLILLLFLIGAISCSIRWGRVATLGWVLLLPSLPGTAFWWAIRQSLPNWITPTINRTQGIKDMIRFIAAEILPAPAASLFALHRALALAGLTLILVAVCGGLLFRPSKPKTTELLAQSSL